MHEVVKELGVRVVEVIAGAVLGCGGEGRLLSEVSLVAILVLREKKGGAAADFRSSSCFKNMKKKRGKLWRCVEA